jgi:hypothetical protein
MNYFFFWQPSPEEFIQKAQERVRTAAYNSLLRGGTKVQGRARYFAPVNLGLLRATIVVVGDISNLSVQVGSKLKYAAPVEFGSKPHTPPLSALQEWADKKRNSISGIVDRSTRRRLTKQGILGKSSAWAIWQKIRMYGTDPHPYLYPAFYENRDWIVDDLAKSIAKAVMKSGE